ncbi:uncharacterized protein [Asterias amurensis]|uniref:uncharacterized protein n=1 Tax=Asterias amurensis TaxID=7602 RepID=UPI003AB7AD30
MAEDSKEVQQQEIIRRMEDELEEPSLETEAVPESESDPPISPILQTAPSTSPPSELPPSQQLAPTQILTQQSAEVSVPFPATCDTTASFSTSFINQGVDLTAFSGGEVVPNIYDNQQAVHTCNKCNSCFASAYELTVHWQEEHRDNFKCKRCERTFAKKHNLLRHNCVNACNICGQQFTRRYNLKLHMQIHGDGSKLHKCEYCGKSFTRRYTLLTHTRSHSGIKLFKCSICGKAFTRQHTLNLHMKRHVTKSSFYCRRCYAVFTDAVSLQLHRETEHAKTPKQPESLITTATSQSIQPTSNVVFPNSNPGYLYGPANVGSSSYHNHMDSFYQPTHQDMHNPFQNTYHGNRGSANNPTQKDGDFGEKNLLHQESGHAASLEKRKWFEDERVGASARGTSSRQETMFMTQPENEVVTVIDSGDEVMNENSLYPDKSNKEREQVDQEPSERDLFIAGDKESDDVDTIETQELEAESRRSLFPINTSKHHRRTARPVNRPMRRSWQHGDKLVKETSEIRINVLDPSAMEEMNPLLTPPRSSDTSTSRPTHNSSESGSPSAASLLESPSYLTRPFPAILKIAPSSPPSAEKTCLPTQIAPQVSCNDVDQEISVHVPPPNSRVDSYSSHRAGNNANSDSSTSSSLLATQRKVKHEDGSQSDSAKWRCTHCGITFEESLMYVVHMGCHGQLDPYQCSMCGMLCQDRMAFTLHIIGGKHIKTQT